ncbi:phosphopantetheine-binding protein [Streptomyces pseudovenezuelae]|uniref:Phosphopantetheine-binding protein n=1 Tax=Streptomyces pseudovenezuelae TaxID=67350 RepID=A0ABZ1X1H7_9ACTN|nr:phosphopantetheine-binding protein [Streptomyces pseudovenezuelae]WUA88755.1 phosphopantetheine-binding protein [Streptomyces pseudovenezuelae]
MNEEIRDFVLAVVRDVINLPVPEGADADTPLGPDGLELESLAMIELLLQLEGEYGVELPEEDVDPESVRTLGQLVQVVVDRRTAVAGAGR